jgi:hypothetical protein
MSLCPKGYRLQEEEGVDNDNTAFFQPLDADEKASKGPFAPA